MLNLKKGQIRARENIFRARGRIGGNLPYDVYETFLIEHIKKFYFPVQHILFRPPWSGSMGKPTVLLVQEGNLCNLFQLKFSVT